MTYRWAVIVLGLVVIGAAVLSPRRPMAKGAASYRRQRLRHNLIAALVFVGMPLLYLFANRLDHPPPPEPPPPITGNNIEADIIIPAPRPSDSRARPKGVTIEPSGFGTLLVAPATKHEIDPYSKAPPLLGLRLGDPAVASEIAHLIRILPRARSDVPAGTLRVIDVKSVVKRAMVMTVPTVVTGTVILRDGCFRLAEKGEPLVLLPAYTRAVLDEAGYLILGPPGTAREMAGRVGETVSWSGPTLEITNPAVTRPLRKACGPGRVVRVGTSSEAVGKNESDASEARSLSSMYGMSYKETRRQVAACQADADRRRAVLRRRFGDDASHWPSDTVPGPCRSSPPPPVSKASDCPTGTTLSGGLCRNEKGFIVQVPPRPLL